MSDHSPTCASGARAEERGPCDCGAVAVRPYRVRIVVGMRPRERRLVELIVDGPLTTEQAVELSIVLQELTKEEGQRWARINANARKP